MTRPKGTRSTCGVPEARQRLIDARQFLEAAELLDAPDVVATNAIHAAIAAADAITCFTLGERSSDGNHSAAVDLLRRVDGSLATSLKRSLDRKTQAGYASRDLKERDADRCIDWARVLVTAAETRLRS